MNGEEEKSSLGPDEILKNEYDSIVKQIIHWDSLFWHKSKFFLAIQSAFLAVVLNEVKEQILTSYKDLRSLFILFLTVAVFNIYLCYVWFRTNRRTREYLKFRIERALEIEDDKDKKLSGILRTFRYTKEHLPECHKSAVFETHIPTAFIVVWTILIVFVIYKFYICYCG